MKKTLPTVEPELLLGFTFIKKEDDGNYRTEVMGRCQHDPEKYLVKTGEGDQEEIIHYSNLLAEWEQMTQEGNEWSEKKVWVFDKFTGHQLKKGRLEVQVDWSDGPKTWEPLSAMALQDPVTCAKYAKDNDLLEMPG